jgi:hypothetical protein
MATFQFEVPPGSYWHPIRGVLCIGRSKAEIEFSLHTSLCECLNQSGHYQ